MLAFFLSFPRSYHLRIPDIFYSDRSDTGLGLLAVVYSSTFNVAPFSGRIHASSGHYSLCVRPISFYILCLFNLILCGFSLDMLRHARRGLLHAIFFAPFVPPPYPRKLYAYIFVALSVSLKPLFPMTSSLWSSRRNLWPLLLFRAASCDERI